MHPLVFHVIAGCFPNCTPDPSSGVGTTPLAQSGDAALGAAVLLIVGVILKAVLFSGKKSKK